MAEPGGLLRRTLAVLAQAWRLRHDMAPPPRLSHEIQFLPEAMALQEQPASPMPHLTLWLLLAFAATTLAWSFLGKMDIVATAMGRIIPDDRTKVIQPLEAATVKEIHVRDGDLVVRGQVLITLDETTVAADVQRLSQELVIAHGQRLRSQALLQAHIDQSPVLPRDQLPAARQEFEEQLLTGAWQAFLAKWHALSAEIEKREAELASALELVGKLEKTSAMAKQRAEDLDTLRHQKVASKHAWMDREQQRIELERDLAVQKKRVVEFRTAVKESRRARELHVADSRKTTLDLLHEADQKWTTARQELIKAEQRLRQMRLTAPVAGTVQQLAIHTLGGVVTPAQALLVIVPGEHPLEVEAFLENKDIGFVQAGQPAEVKVDAFPYTKYGTLAGTVKQVSGDAVQNEQKGWVFVARINLDQTAMKVEQKTIPLSPGMTVAVEIKTDKRRIIDYFLSPLRQHARESLGER